MDIFSPIITKLKILKILNDNDNPLVIFHRLIMKKNVYQFNISNDLICQLKILKDNNTLDCLTIINNNDADILCFVDIISIPKPSQLSFSYVFSDFLFDCLYEFTDKFPDSVGYNLFAHNLYFLSTIPVMFKINFHYKAINDFVFPDKLCCYSDMRNCNYGFDKLVLRGLYKLCESLDNYPQLMKSKNICFREFFCCFSQNYLYYLLYLHFTNVQCKVYQLGRWIGENGVPNLDVNNIFNYNSPYSEICMIQLAMHSLFIGDNLREYFYRTCCKVFLASKTVDNSKFFSKNTIIHESNCYYLSDAVHAKLLVSVIMSSKFKSKFPAKFIIAADRMLVRFLTFHKPVVSNTANDVLLKVGALTLHSFLNHLNYVCELFQTTVPLPTDYKIPDDVYNSYGSDKEFTSLFLTNVSVKVSRGNSGSINLRRKVNIAKKSSKVSKVSKIMKMSSSVLSVNLDSQYSPFANIRSSSANIRSSSSAPDSSSCIYNSPKSISSNVFQPSSVLSSSIDRSDYVKHPEYDDIMFCLSNSSKVKSKSKSKSLSVPISTERVLRSNNCTPNSSANPISPVTNILQTLPLISSDNPIRRVTRSLSLVQAVVPAAVVVPITSSSKISNYNGISEISDENSLRLFFLKSKVFKNKVLNDNDDKYFEAPDEIGFCKQKDIYSDSDSDINSYDDV